MKSKFWKKFAKETLTEDCNNWCCPCNDGCTGCFANDKCAMLCENSRLSCVFHGERDEWDKMLDESYDAEAEYYATDNMEVYNNFCQKAVKKFNL